MIPELQFRCSDSGRIDRVLSDQLGIAKALAHRLLLASAVRADGQLITAKGHQLRRGSAVEIDREVWIAEHRAEARPDVALRVLADTDAWVCIDKPAGMAVHPLHGGQTDTALNALLVQYPEIQDVGEGGLRSGVVHRLDVGTSGVLLFAREQLAWQNLREAFSAHRMDKSYVAVVTGQFEHVGKVELSLAMAQSQPARVAVVDEDGNARGQRNCTTRVRPLETGAERSLVEVRPRTGYLHQIRVTLAHLGHPVVGDELYGGPPAERMALHAQRLVGAGVEAESEVPSEFTVL